ncbi:MAG: tyrosine recombinase XerC [Clostridia bacterium]|nr:tyrosine recombinase XerC [Clostridia bacterium]
MARKKRKVSEDKSPVVERFLRYKLVIQARSPKTVDEYRIDLHTFFSYLVVTREGRNPNDVDFCDVSIAGVDDAFAKSVTTLDILEFLMFAANARGNTASSRARKLSAIKSFYKYLVATERIMEKNPAVDIEAPKKKSTLPKYLSQEESISLLTSIAGDTDSKYKERNFCIVTLFLNCGMRLSELVSINLSDIDRELRSLRVLGKGGKERIVYLNDACREALTVYLTARARDMEKIKDKDALFLSRLGKRISNKTVQWLVYKYLEEAGLEYKHFSTHKLRHTAATLMYQEGGVDVLALKEILGHTQLSTTQIYTHVNNRQLEEAVTKNPLAGIRPSDMRAAARKKAEREKAEADENKTDEDGDVDLR